MSSAMHNIAAVRDRDRCDEDQGLCADISNGLHALAQPLTILRSTIGLIDLSMEAGTDGRRYVDLSVQQMDRTCRLFASIQGLLASKMEPPIRAEADLRWMLSNIIDERAGTLERLGIGIAVRIPDSIRKVICDPRRTEQAFSAVLDAGAAICRRGDVIELKAFHSEEFYEFTVQRAGRHGNRIDSSSRLYLSLAKENILSQEGMYQFTGDPFCVAFCLPVAKSSCSKLYAGC